MVHYHHLIILQKLKCIIKDQVVKDIRKDNAIDKMLKQILQALHIPNLINEFTFLQLPWHFRKQKELLYL